MSVPTDIKRKDLRGVLWNWRPVADQLPGRCGASDIDGVVERRGHFLFLEGKSPGERLSTGQLIMLRALAGLGDRVTVVVVTGDRNTGEITEYRQVKASGLGPVIPGSEFNSAIKRWWRKANGERQ